MVKMFNKAVKTAVHQTKREHLIIQDVCSCSLKDKLVQEGINVGVQTAAL